MGVHWPRTRKTSHHLWNNCTWNILVILLCFALESRSDTSLNSSPIATEDYNLDHGFVPEEERLYYRMFDRYNRQIRPVRHATDPVNIKLTFSLLQIHTLDEKSQVFRTYGWLIIEWEDTRLRWNPAEFGNMTEFVVDSSQLWTPELALINAVEYQFPDFAPYRAIVVHNGRVRWEPAGVFETSCKIDITFYPYDSQECALVFGTWAYTSAQVNFTNSTDSVVLDDYNTSGEWHISGTRVARDEFIYECCPNIRFSKVSATITLDRRHRFYTMNIVMPCAMLSSLTLVTFLSPPDQGEKISLGISILLSFSVFMLSLSENMPKTSESLPLFGIYTTFVMMMNTWSVMLTVLVLILHHRNETKPVPRWVRVVAFEGLARLLCMYSKRDKRQRRDYLKYVSRYEEEQLREQQIPLRGRKASKGAYSLAAAAQQFTGNARNSAPLFIPPGGASRGGSCPPGGGKALGNSSHKQSSANHSSDERDFKRDFECLMQQERYNNFGLQEWKKLARIVDRLFFWLTLLALISVSAVMCFLLWS